MIVANTEFGGGGSSVGGSVYLTIDVLAEGENESAELIGKVSEYEEQLRTSVSTITNANGWGKVRNRAGCDPNQLLSAIQACTTAINNIHESFSLARQWAEAFNIGQSLELPEDGRSYEGDGSGSNGAGGNGDNNKFAGASGAVAGAAAGANPGDGSGKGDTLTSTTTASMERSDSNKTVEATEMEAFLKELEDAGYDPNALSDAQREELLGRLKAAGYPDDKSQFDKIVGEYYDDIETIGNWRDKIGGYTDQEYEDLLKKMRDEGYDPDDFSDDQVEKLLDSLRNPDNKGKTIREILESISEENQLVYGPANTEEVESIYEPIETPQLVYGPYNPNDPIEPYEIIDVPSTSPQLVYGPYRPNDPIEPYEPIYVPSTSPQLVYGPYRPTDPIDKPILEPSEPIDVPYTSPQLVYGPYRPTDPIDEPILKPDNPISDPVNPDNPISDPVNPTNPTNPTNPSNPNNPYNPSSTGGTSYGTNPNVAGVAGGASGTLTSTESQTSTSDSTNALGESGAIAGSGANLSHIAIPKTGTNAKANIGTGVSSKSSKIAIAAGLGAASVAGIIGRQAIMPNLMVDDDDDDDDDEEEELDVEMISTDDVNNEVGLGVAAEAIAGAGYLDTSEEEDSSED